MILTVCAAGCAYTSVAAAVRSAPPHATILVRGAQRGDAIVDRPLTLRGSGDATISGGASGIVVRSPGVRIEGLRFDGYAGEDRSGRNAAVVLLAPDAVVRSNRFTGNAFAIVALRAPRAAIADNTIDGLAASDPDAAGDSIRLWYSPSAQIRENVIRYGRDILISYSNNVLVRGNAISFSRYGLHDMFSDSLNASGNTFRENEIGANFMYARRVTVEGNTFTGNHGPAGYGLGMEDVDSSRITRNRFILNHTGVSAVDSPSNPSAPDVFEGNVFSHNGSAMSLQSDPHALRVIANAFVDNIEDVEVSGGGPAQGVAWSAGGRGNFWSAYAGYDRNGDRIGDLPYAPQDAFNSLTDTHQELQMFRYSPAALAVEFAARAFPTAGSVPKLVDSAPMLGMPPVTALSEPSSRSPLGALLALLCAAPLAVLRGSRRLRARGGRKASRTAAGAAALEAVSARKVYGRGRGIQDVTLSVAAGESVALWGPNGAGKTTFFRCVLGERLDAGTLQVFGRAPSPNDLRSRAAIGYAPQNLPDFDSNVGDLADLVAALRGADRSEADRALALLDLSNERPRNINELSGGMRQRLGIALALIADPAILLLDEPTAGLDRASRERAIAILQAERARGKTLIFTSHLLEDVRALADRVVTFDAGISVESVSAEFFTTRYLRNIS